MIIPEGYLKRKGKIIPFGYELSEIEGYFKPIPEQLEVLHKYLQGIKQQKFSLREASQLIENKTGRKISHVSIKNYLDTGVSLEEKHKKTLAKKKNKLAKEKHKLLQREQRLKKQQEVLKKATEKTTSNVVTNQELEFIEPTVQEQIKDKKVLFHPNEGPQTEFLAASEKDVLYGGCLLYTSPSPRDS